ncbi:unnamed protein product [Penicillium salamii]|uniref:Uncharacterized protein n=1 Tax=Penicillium salamii TaxID=1612424 RepID=A0A9W4NIC9_9EURO|nr:unnamed protein product [Penicillium salamii]CAG8189811.1 unnamed protein product [Penicillium salamii]CAG8261064.1 unnamed protein product [Penicillium salamii]CAG8314656.1 unnamed protein product [Penicillium salamii]CAG8370381.1 unnamed protein product [Penicillium salamii]
MDTRSIAGSSLSEYQPAPPDSTGKGSPNDTMGNKLREFFRWMCTPLGACITVYGLNIVAWGGMLFLLMCNAAPAMCHPTCDSLESPRRIWIEIDSQILNALFCVTGFGLAPWRIRDLYRWCCWRLARSDASRRNALNRLAEIHQNWFLKSQDPDLLPRTSKQSDQEIQWVTPTPLWKMDVVVWGNMLNSVFQLCLAVFMWAFNRFNRPSWTTGLFVGLACAVAGVAGILMWLEKKRVQKGSEHPGALLLIPRATDPIILGGESANYSPVDRKP